jgi:hypothetical protein
VLAQKGADADDTTRHESCQAVYLKRMPKKVPPPDAPDEDVSTKPKRKVPLHKRFPNQWCTRSVIYTPMTRIEFTGPIDKETGKLILTLLSSGAKVRLPATQKAIRAFNEQLSAK